MYTCIDKQILNVRNIDLPLKTHRKPRKSVSRINKRLYGKSTSGQHKTVEERKGFEHWEIGTVIGKRPKKQALLALTGRKTHKHLILLLGAKNAKAVDKAPNHLKKQFEPLFFAPI